MQAKRYALLREATLAPSGILSNAIINDDSRRTNFHGIRWSGRIRADNATADNEAHGQLVILCKSNSLDNPTEPDFDTSGNLEDQSGIIVMIKPWSVFGGSTNPVGYGTFFDWDVAIATSRNCSKNDELVFLFVSNAESAKNAVVTNSLGSCFETTL